MSPLEPEELWDFSECRRYLSLGRSRLRRLVNDNVIPHLLIGPEGKLRFDPREVRRWLRESAEVTAEKAPSSTQAVPAHRPS